MWGAQVSRYDLLSHDRAASMPGAPLFNNNAIYQGAAMFRDAVSTASIRADITLGPKERQKALAKLGF